jgi:hypothetical protein
MLPWVPGKIPRRYGIMENAVPNRELATLSCADELRITVQ